MARAKPAELTEELNEVWRLVVGYSKQEAGAPLRGIASFARYGVAGIALFAIGSAFAALAILRALQTQTDAFDGNWSFVPYLASIFGCAIVLGFAIRAVARTPWKSEQAKSSKGDTK